MTLISGLGMLGMIELRERPTQPLVAVELRFGTELSADVAHAMIASIAGLPSGSVVKIDTFADAGGIRYFLLAYGGP